MPPDPTQAVLLWSGSELRAVADAPAGALLAADSWLVDEGRVRGYDRHWARFAGWCADFRVAAAEVERFRIAVTAALPRSGRWFPRVDLVGSVGGRAGDAADLVLRLRPATPPLRTARVLLAEPGDLRRHPRRKGPDLALLRRLRDEAIAIGADELVLRDSAGRLLEGALNSLLWWDGGALCSPPDEHTLPSVTRALLFELAHERGVAVRRHAPLPAELAGSEAWLANAADGICVVTAWQPDGPAPGPAPRAASWDAALRATARPLDAG